MVQSTLSGWSITEEKVKINHPSDVGNLRDIINEIMRDSTKEKMISKQSRYYRAGKMDELKINLPEGNKTGFFGFDEKRSSMIRF